MGLELCVPRLHTFSIRLRTARLFWAAVRLFGQEGLLRQSLGDRSSRLGPAKAASRLVVPPNNYQGLNKNQSFAAVGGWCEREPPRLKR
jgi:hypothetical protein